MSGSVSFGQAACAQQTDTTPQEVRQGAKFTDDEIRQFLKANAKVTAIQKEGQQTMPKIIEDANMMGVDKFNMFAQAQREQKLAHALGNSLPLTKLPSQLQGFSLL